jgi:phosphoglycerol transferase MdoB-like AlkP superfamily enzyme
MSEPTSTVTENQANRPQPTAALIAMTYLNHIIIVLAAIAISQMTVLVETDPEWGVVLAERPWLKSAALVASAMLGVVLFRYSRWTQAHLGTTHRNALLLLVLSAFLAWLLLTPVM